jgi:hypothetical protein
MDRFYMFIPHDEVEFEWQWEEDESLYRVGQNGNGLV